MTEWWKYGIAITGSIIIGTYIGGKVVEEGTAKRVCSATGMTDLQTLVSKCPNVNGQDISTWLKG